MNSLTLPRWFGRKKKKEKAEKKQRQSVILAENPYENLHFLGEPQNADLDVNEAIRGSSEVQYRLHSTPLGGRSLASHKVDDYFDDNYEDLAKGQRPFSFDEGRFWSWNQGLTLLQMNKV